ncbi:MAG: protein TolR [Gammaproteobacteria bacterium]
MSDINVVPYIDVMLVLLIIFMITAPLITQGVKIDLPQAPSQVIPPSEIEPVVVSVDKNGQFFIDIGENPESVIDGNALIERVAKLLKLKPDTEFLVRGDENVSYGSVVSLMTLLQEAGVPSVGLVTEPPEH